MNDLLEKAFQAASRLPNVEQTALAQRILAELESEAQWEQRFADHLEVLDKMAEEALQERAAGETTPLDFMGRRRTL
ncbi:MAG: hypothetical protein HQL78_02670 [Magnetococcales bacterium]|nr:hypothetical protein [Magnetococcales bacterium]MBF0419050.1 hypothetical protein [Magnetococcales bacterium]